MTIENIEIELIKNGFEKSPNSRVLAEFRNEDVPILRVNKAFTDFYGYNEDEVIGKNPRVLNSEKMELDYFQKMWESILNPKIGFWKGDIINKKKNGDFINVILTIITIFDEKDVPRYFTAYHVDITERKITEEKLKEAELRSKEAYEQVNFYKDIFAHDMNNILQVILSSAELTSLYLDTPEKLSKIKGLNNLILDQVSRGNKLIENVQELSKIKDSKPHLKRMIIDPVLEESINLVKHSIQNMNVNIQVEPHENDLVVNANDLLLDVFENLLYNGVRHNNNDDVEILVRISRITKKSQKFIKMEFIDNGRGVEVERKETIFQKKSTINKGGHSMGLGLSLVKKILNNYNGSIWIEDKIPGDCSKGSNFILLLPEVE
ncbi:MAG: ATP-binding protein [Promethearchaeota archaeon]